MSGDTDKIDFRDTFLFQLRSDFNANQCVFTSTNSLPIYAATTGLRLLANMKSLRRDLSANPQAENVTSKIFVRSTKSGKVQKIVRELYLRQDIPCSSKLCPICPSVAPVDANGNSEIRPIAGYDPWLT